MASKKTLNAKNLEALGATRLARLLLEITTGDAVAKRRLRLELAGEESAADVAKEVRKRLTALERARSFVDWHQIKSLAGDLEIQREAIVNKIAKEDPVLALDLMWRYLQLASSLYDRADDSNGVLQEVFWAALSDTGPLALAAGVDRKRLADKVFESLLDNRYGEYDGVIEILADALGAQGLEYLKQKFAAFRQQPRSEPAPGNRRILGWGLDGPLYARNIEADSRERAVSRALADIADAQGDADSYMAQYSSEQRRHPPIAAEIAQRLLAAGRTDEALKIANAAKPGRMDWPDFDLDDVKIAIHETAGNKEAAQAVRWSCFERFLSVEYLRDYVKALPDFEDVAALDRAMKHAEGFRDAHFALQFFLDWPNLDAAANLVLNKTKEFDGRHYEVLTAGARMLAGDHPLAASMLLRAMIDFALKSKRTSRYKHIGKHFAECGVLSESIENFGQYPNHVTYSLQLRKDHGQKRSFWDAVP